MDFVYSIALLPKIWQRWESILHFVQEQHVHGCLTESLANEDFQTLASSTRKQLACFQWEERVCDSIYLWNSAAMLQWTYNMLLVGMRQIIIITKSFELKSNSKEKFQNQQKVHEINVIFRSNCESLGADFKANKYPKPCKACNCFQLNIRSSF